MPVNTITLKNLRSQLKEVTRIINLQEDVYVSFYKELYVLLEKESSSKEVQFLLSHYWKEWNDITINLINARINFCQLIFLYTEPMNGPIKKSKLIKTKSIQEYFQEEFQVQLEEIPQLQIELDAIQHFNPSTRFPKKEKYTMEDMGYLESYSHLVFYKMTEHGNRFITDLTDFINRLSNKS